MKMTDEVCRKLLELVKEFREKMCSIECIKNSEYTQNLFDDMLYYEVLIRKTLQSNDAKSKGEAANYVFQLICENYRLKIIGYPEIEEDANYQSVVDEGLRALIRCCIKDGKWTIADLYHFIINVTDILNFGERNKTKVVTQINAICKHNMLIRKWNVDSILQLKEFIWLLYDVNHQFNNKILSSIDLVHHNVCIFFGEVICEGDIAARHDFEFFARVLTPNYIKLSEFHGMILKIFSYNLVTKIKEANASNDKQELSLVEEEQVNAEEEQSEIVKTRSIIEIDKQCPKLVFDHAHLILDTLTKILALFLLRRALSSREVGIEQLKNNKRFTAIRSVISKMLTQWETYQLKSRSCPWLKDDKMTICLRFINAELSKAQARLYSLTGREQPENFHNKTKWEYLIWYKKFYAMLDSKLTRQLSLIDKARQAFVSASHNRDNLIQLKELLKFMYRNTVFTDWYGTVVEISNKLDIALSNLPKQNISPRGNESGSENELDLENEAVSRFAGNLRWRRIFTTGTEIKVIEDGGAQIDEVPNSGAQNGEIEPSNCQTLSPSISNS